jgi:hypothetical protein
MMRAREREEVMTTWPGCYVFWGVNAGGVVGVCEV